MVIGDMLGYPEDMWERVRHWSERTMTLGGQTYPAGPPHFMDPGMVSAITEFMQVTAELIETRRKRSARRPDLALDPHRGLDTQHVLDETILVLDGGAETTRTVIGSMMRELALQPGQRQLLIKQPALLTTTAVEEFIRWVSPISNMRRTATVDHELHGEQIHQGDELLLLYGAANLDPRAFPNPDVLDVTREHNAHVAFGFGTHVCLGAHLARLEIRVMFEELLRRMPDWELVDPDEPKIVPATFARGYDQIRIRYTPGP